MQVGIRPYGHPKIRHGKSYALKFDNEKLACVILGTMFDLLETKSIESLRYAWQKFRVKKYD